MRAPVRWILVALILATAAAAHAADPRITPSEARASVPSAELVQGAPSISLDKTVGLSSSTCALTDSVLIGGGGATVYYCYEVTNTGALTLTSHDLTDSELGVILDDFPYSLAPGAAAFITQSALITQTTVNTATWTAFLSPPFAPEGNSATASDVATVTLGQGAITVEKTVGTSSSTCAVGDTLNLPVGGGTVYYCYTVTNTGNLTLTRHDLVDSELGSILTNFPFTLVPAASAFITQSATITQTTVNNATWTAYNPGPVDTAAAGDSATVNVEVGAPSITHEKTVGTDSSTCAVTDVLDLPPGGGTVYYCYTVTNTGNVTLTRHDLLDSELGPLLSDFPFSLIPGASAFLTSSALITETTVNTSTWTAFNPGPVDSASAGGSATVNVADGGPSILEIPTASSVGLALLALLLALVSLQRVRRFRRSD
jgi:hypothetical protein